MSAYSRTDTTTGRKKHSTSDAMNVFSSYSKLDFSSVPRVLRYTKYRCKPLKLLMLKTNKRFLKNYKTIIYELFGNLKGSVIQCI